MWPQQPATGRWVPTGRLNAPRGSHTATRLLDGSVLVVGGSSEGTPLTSAERYDPRSGTWSVTGSLATARFWHTATLLGDGTVLVTGGAAGGIDRFERSFALATVERYDPGHGVWRSGPRLSFARDNHFAVRLTDGRVLVAGSGGVRERSASGEDVTALGPDPGERRRLAELFDPAQDQWFPAGRMGVGRTNPTATVLADGRVLVAGGTTPSPTATAELFDPHTGAWTAAAEMASPRSYHAAVLLADGRVLVTGGIVHSLPGPSIITVSTESYDPRTGTWTVGAPMRERRWYHTAVVLADGRVLVAGGYGEDARYALASAELYDPSTDTWQSAGTMCVPHRLHTATRLANGQVLVVGGGLEEGAATAELYKPDPP